MLKQSGLQNVDEFSRFRRAAQQPGGSNSQNGGQNGPGNGQQGPHGQGQRQGGAPGQGEGRNN